MIVHGILLAAGRGERFGGPKVEATLGGRPLWEWGLDALRAGGVDQVIVVGPVPGGIPGGVRRRDSVAAGLDGLPAEATHVLIHDAARPLAGAQLVFAVIARLEVGDVDGVVPVLEVTDTIKRIGDDMVEGTVERNGLATVQTPQGFVVESLRAAHAAHPGDAPDDAFLVELWGGRVAVVPGDPANLKVTRPGDLDLLSRLLS